MAYDADEARLLLTLGRLTRGVLHEIANPLLALTGSAELALMSAEPGSKLHDRIALTHRTGTEITEMVRALQAFIRLQEEPVRELSVGEEAAAAVELVALVLPTRDRELRARGDATVTAAPGELRRALVELAAEALERAEPDAAVELVVSDGVVRASGGGELRL